MKSTVIKWGILSLSFFYISTTFCKQATISKSLTNKEATIKNAYHGNFWGVFMQNKQPQKALNIFNSILQENKYVYKWLINFLYQKGQYQQIQKYIPLIKARCPELLTNDPDTGFRVAYSLVVPTAQKKAIFLTPLAYNPKAMDILVPLNNKFPTHRKIASLISTLYDINNDPQNALAVSEKYLNSSATKPVDFIEYFKNAARYVKLEKLQKSLEAVKKSIDLQPKFINSWLFSAAIKAKLMMLDEAIKDCIAALKIVGPNQKVIQFLLTLFFKKKSRQQFTTALQLFKGKKYKQALEYMETCLEKTAK